LPAFTVVTWSLTGAGPWQGLGQVDPVFNLSVVGERYKNSENDRFDMTNRSTKEGREIANKYNK
jgi:hypothetical protein